MSIGVSGDRYWPEEAAAGSSSWLWVDVGGEVTLMLANEPQSRTFAGP